MGPGTQTGQSPARRTPCRRRGRAWSWLLFPSAVFAGRRIGQGILEFGQQRQQFVDTLATEPAGDFAMDAVEKRRRPRHRRRSLGRQREQALAGIVSARTTPEITGRLEVLQDARKARRQQIAAARQARGVRLAVEIKDANDPPLLFGDSALAMVRPA